jgi:NADH pyrophosphatase NudC (nudix superfamily)
MNILCDLCVSALRKSDEKMKFCPKCGRELKPAEIDGRTRLSCSSAKDLDKTNGKV